MEQEKEFPIEEFKKLLSTFIKRNLKGYHVIAEAIDEAEPTERSILSELIWNADNLYEALGGNAPNVSDLEDEISDLEDEISDLQYDMRNLEEENDILERELKTAKLTFGGTLNDKYKIQFFREHHEKYTPWEIEELLINGSELLKRK
jgi:chromosome segregation ATPase